MRGNIELLSENRPVTGSLIQHDNEVGVFKNILHFTAGKQVFYILGDASGKPAPLAEPLPDLHGIRRRLFFLQEQMKLVYIVTGRLSGAAVGRHAAPHLILHHEHTEFFELFAEFLDVIAHQPVGNVHVGAVIKEVEGACDIDFKSRGHMTGLFLLLDQQRFIQVLQYWHILRHGIFKILLVDLMDTAVNDRFLYGLQALLAAYHQFTQGQDEVRFQGNGIILLTVIEVDVHGIDILAAGRTDFNNLPLQPLHQRRILRLRVADDNIIVGHEESVRNLSFCGERFTGTRGAENQAVGILQRLAIHHDKVVGERVQPIIQGFRPVLIQLLRGEWHEDGRGAGGHGPLNLNQVLRQGKR